MSSPKTYAQLLICLLLAIDLNAALPEPPSQRLPWHPPDVITIPEYVVKVTTTLFAAGLADPRGGSYREVQLAIPGGDKKTLATHAWTFPDGTAVAWNGLVHRVQAVGPPADLHHDVHLIVSAHPWSARMLVRSMTDHDPESAAFWYSLSGQTLAPTSIALLLRLGRADLAADLWKAPEGGADGCFGCPVKHEADEASWMVTAARVWLGTGYSRLVSAFVRHDYLDAVDLAESLLQWQQHVPEISGERKDWFSFLSPVPALLVDSKRRLQERPRADISASPLVRTQAARIADLIERLEDVEGSKIAFPGQLMYSLDPVYAALKKDGEAAVAPLIDVYDFDKRLTLTFDYGRPWQIERTPIPVHDVVDLLLGEILGDARIGNSSPADLRSWWAQRKSHDRSERSFETLADDQATPEQWLAGANFLTARPDMEWSKAGWISEQGACDPRKAAPDVNGKDLRKRQNPSVGELIARRTANLVASGSDLACSMSVKAAMWDAKAALPVLQQAATLKSCRANHLVAIARQSLGVPGAAAEWDAELVAHPKFPPLGIDELSPLWMFPADAVLEQTSERLFASSNSRWSPVLRWQEINSPLLTIPIYRQAVLSALEDSKVVGKAGRKTNGYLYFNIANGGGGGSGPSDDPKQAPPGEERLLRVMDMVAWELSNLEGSPTFGLDWTNTDKDEAKSAIAQFLRAHENELGAFPMQLRDTNCPGQQLYLKH